jgi:adenosyl cobinamide kinase/adenosyl cobinamide phosphate guanylyltransferase
MARNLLVYAADPGPVAYAAKIAEAAGEDLGLVVTAIEFHREKVSGGRIEEERDYAETRFNTFDEPIFIGSAIAQLAGHAEAVVVDGLEDWVGRLQQRFANEPVELDAEISSLMSVMQARMADLVLVARPEVVQDAKVRSLLARVLGQLEPRVDVIVELRRGAPRATKGALPV